MKKLLFLSFIISLFALQVNAQRINFEYDAAGNQVNRSYCSCPAKMSNQSEKKITDLKPEDLQKFFPEDVLSYYPNPVKEQLFLKWDIINGNKVKTIDIYSTTGQLIKEITQFDTENTHIVIFNELAVGMYLLNLNYSNGDVKNINIVKE